MIVMIVIIVILEMKVANKIIKKRIQMKEKCPICGEMFDFWEDNGGVCEVCIRDVCNSCYIYIDDVRCDYGIVCADCVNDIDCSDEVIEEAIREKEDYI